MSFKVPEKFRVTKGVHGTSEIDGNNGAFEFTGLTPTDKRLFVIASDGMGWEHVSVSKKMGTPSWNAMCAVKDLFWGKEDLVVQYHPPESEYVNNHEHCLHLWRPIGIEIPLPPSIMVGIKGLDSKDIEKRIESRAIEAALKRQSAILKRGN